MDKGFNKYDPHMIAETKMNAIKNLSESNPDSAKSIADIFSSFGD